MNSDTLKVLETWKEHQFRKTDLKLKDVVASLGSEESLVEPKQLGKSKDYWAYFNPKTGKPAVVTFAMLWAWNAPFATGNFVPEGQDLPSDLPANRVQQVPSPKCVYSCAFDTNLDASIYKHIKVIEATVHENEVFNRFRRPKYTWQEPDNPTTNHCYIFSSRVFSKRTIYNCSSDGIYTVPYKVHPWIKAACSAPDKKWASPPYFEKGDVVWMSFVIAFTMQTSSWTLSLQPLEFVRVATTDPPVTGPNNQSTDMTDLLNLEPLGSDSLDDIIDSSTKRKRDEEMVDTSDGSINNNYPSARESPPWDLLEKASPEAVADDMDKMDISEEVRPTTKKRASGRRRND
ncbi:hypothetical protein BKA70DRAFT_1426173 [Coprinopsis sp. MPI-PUGE-AT-0042]|nr:hypothetical protein BKA70DRAFT_1426173 [Coprinopsis sp. MPI-PUGE-AT-0042]